MRQRRCKHCKTQLKGNNRSSLCYRCSAKCRCNICGKPRLSQRQRTTCRKCKDVVALLAKIHGDRPDSGPGIKVCKVYIEERT